MRNGRPQQADTKELLFYEHAWTLLFLQVREGSAETREEIPGGEGAAMLLRSSERDRETLQIFRPGTKARKLTAHKAMGQDWRKRVKLEEREFDSIATGEKSLEVLRPAIPGEPHLWEALKKAQSAAEVRRICRRSKHWLKWEWSGEMNGRRWYFQVPSRCPKALYDHAAEFCEAKRSDRYPRSNDRPSSDDKRIEYLARVMAGLSLERPIAPATAVDVLRKMKHEGGCSCWRCALRQGN